MIWVLKDLHANPEPGFMETRPAGIVAAALKEQGFEVKEGIGKTGVAGILRNGKEEHIDQASNGYEIAQPSSSQ